MSTTIPVHVEAKSKGGHQPMAWQIILSVCAKEFMQLIIKVSHQGNYVFEDSINIDKINNNSNSWTVDLVMNKYHKINFKLRYWRTSQWYTC